MDGSAAAVRAALRCRASRSALMPWTSSAAAVMSSLDTCNAYTHQFVAITTTCICLHWPTAWQLCTSAVAKCQHHMLCSVMSAALAHLHWHHGLSLGASTYHGRQGVCCSTAVMHSRKVEVGSPQRHCRCSKTTVAAAAARACINLGALLSLWCRLLNVYRGSSSVKGTGGSLWMAGSRAPLPASTPSAQVNISLTRSIS